MGGERSQLGRDGVGDLVAAVPDVREPEPCGRVEVLGAVRVPDRRALAAGEHELVALDLAHRGERVPEVGRRAELLHRARLTSLSPGPACDDSARMSSRELRGDVRRPPLGGAASATTSPPTSATSIRATSSRWCGRASTARRASSTGASCRIWRTRRRTRSPRAASTRGDRVAVVLPPTPETAAVFFGVWKLGAILLSMSVLYGDDGIEHRLSDSRRDAARHRRRERAALRPAVGAGHARARRGRRWPRRRPTSSASTRRPTIRPSSTTRRARPGSRRGSCTRTATSSPTRSSSTATRSRTASASTAWASGPGRRASRRCSGRGGSARCSASTGARAASTRTGSSTSSAGTASRTSSRRRRRCAR